MHLGQRWEEVGASDVSLITGSPQDPLLTEQAQAQERTALPLLYVPSRWLISLEQWRGDNIHPPPDFFEHL